MLGLILFIGFKKYCRFIRFANYYVCYSTHISQCSGYSETVLRCLLSLRVCVCPHFLGQPLVWAEFQFCECANDTVFSISPSYVRHHSFKLYNLL